MTMTVMRPIVAALVLVVGVLEAQAVPTGRVLPGLEPYDEFMTTLIRKWGVVGAGLAVDRDTSLRTRAS